MIVMFSGVVIVIVVFVVIVFVVVFVIVVVITVNCVCGQLLCWFRRNSSKVLSTQLHK